MRRAALVDVALGAAHRLVAAGTEGLVAGAGQDDGADGVVVVGTVEGVDQFGDRLRAKGVAPIPAVDRDPGDAFGSVVEDVGVGGLAFPGGKGGWHGRGQWFGKAASIASGAAGCRLLR